MSHHQPLQNVGDVSLAAGVGSSPIWAPWMSDVNELLTLITLTLGMVLAAVRLWVAFQDWRSTSKKEKTDG